MIYFAQELNMFPIAMFHPRLDAERKNPFLPEDPLKLIEQKRFNAVPFMTGVTQNEGALFIAGMYIVKNYKA